MNNTEHPAFPLGANPLLRIEPGKAPELVGGFGLTKLEYFASRAPVEPQAWFKPVMGIPRPKEVWPEGSPHKNDDPLSSRGYVGGQRPSPLNLAELIEWDIECSRQYAIQWPFAWARAVLEAGEKA